MKFIGGRKNIGQVTLSTTCESVFAALEKFSAVARIICTLDGQIFDSRFGNVESAAFKWHIVHETDRILSMAARFELDECSVDGFEEDLDPIDDTDCRKKSKEIGDGVFDIRLSTRNFRNKDNTCLGTHARCFVT